MLCNGSPRSVRQLATATKEVRMIEKTITKIAYPRVSITGNPSDGFWGKCVSMAFSNYSAECNISESYHFLLKRPGFYELLLPNSQDLPNYFDQYFPVNNRELPYLVENNKLALAVIKTFYDFCNANSIWFWQRPFRMIYHSTIPYSLGFSGSTAMSMSILRALDEFYSTGIHEFDLESIVLHAETHELSRTAGPQDPVAVGRERCCYMDFSKERYKAEATGNNLNSLEDSVIHIDYSSDESYLSNKLIMKSGGKRFTAQPFVEEIVVPDGFQFFIITRDAGSDSSAELSPNAIAYRNGNKKVIEGMARISYLAPEAREAIINGDVAKLGRIINTSFELSTEFFDNDYLGRENIQLVKDAIRCGACAKFPGSGGAVFGLCPSEEILHKLTVLEKLKLMFREGYKIELLRKVK